ncbi:hypothetical protein QT562_15250 [Xanthomonas citri pv. citri]|uniref:Uncharacterized protein n=1 Tax=Xanthomonas citri pv. citri TaxID=611301 RepID=A0A0U5FC51_XANCI|nr:MULTISPECIES: hypothetical protein [Xanthomonas]AGH77154.1 hypothetical protein XAC29_08340 [Xanthomonas axonopodis Xac29-1]AJD68252.1 hypothetical protein J151_01810 [Xanthomonas citri subsp. citri A306]AJY90632.1 hypothetical protein J169_01807 [Xanthomonas citri pv. citri]AJZ08373.1 hypothetical protein J172_01801 [Xanthomonas citri pv. citri]AJZ30541.1 hypothetical protein J171_01803 [Xanthomonas citri pv. citri]
MGDDASPARDWLLPQVYRDLIQVVGRDHTFTLCGHALASGVRRKGRGLVGWLYIPSNQWAPTYATYTALIGQADTEKLIAAFAGDQLEINEPGSWLDARRNASILRTWQAPEQRHLTTPMVGWLHNVTGRTVQNIVRGIPRAAA